ncbi:hypothetical protein ISN45_At04g020900 [Arabidopsis thaliana x Arabidopsis arenosa]|nr:hypothetical protein ISN45_At04g020900 [Arabidopsis thaliana x Arabidopsis arenosa]KAG7621115.1 hypothetical protein ISN44_As04g020440 [Arabidopsis suecica]
MATVSQACADGSWIRPRGRHLILLLRACLPIDIGACVETHLPLKG